MKTKLCVLVLLLCAVFIGGTGLVVNVFPVFSLNTFASESSDYEPNLYDLYRYLSYPPFSSISLSISLGDTRAFVSADLRQELSAFLLGRDWSNLPISADSLAPFVDPNFPRVGYLHYQNDSAVISAGRRKLGWGPGEHSFSLSTAAPYFDHIWLELHNDTSFGEIFYGFFAVASDRTASGGPKTTIGHKYGLEVGGLRLCFAEQNLVYGTYPDLQDLGPFLIFHHTYQDLSNVIGFIMAEYSLGPVRVFGEFALDDFRLPTESKRSNPHGFGWSTGFDVQLMEGDIFETKGLFDEDHALESRWNRFSGGLRFGYEFYHSSTYMYNRDVEIGKYTNPVRFNLFWTNWTTINTFYGFPYGADARLHTAMLSWESLKCRHLLKFEHIVIGAHGIDGDYGNPDVVDGDPFDQDWYGPVEPAERISRLSLDSSIALGKDLLLLLSPSVIVHAGEIDFDIRVGLAYQIVFR